MAYKLRGFENMVSFNLFNGSRSNQHTVLQKVVPADINQTESKSFYSRKSLNDYNITLVSHGSNTELL